MKFTNDGFKKFAVIGGVTLTLMTLMGCSTRPENNDYAAVTQPEVSINQPVNNDNSDEATGSTENNETVGGLYTSRPDQLPEGVRFIDANEGLTDVLISEHLSGIREGVVEFAERAREAGFEWVQDPDAMLRIDVPATVSEEEFRHMLDSVQGAESAFWNGDGTDFDPWNVMILWAMSGGAPIRTYPNN